MQRKIFFYLTISFWILLFSASAIAMTWSQMGWQVKNEKTEDAAYYGEFTDSQGIPIFVQAQTKPDEVEKKKMFAIYKRVVRWQNVKFERLRFTYSDGVVEALLVPKQFSYNGKDFTPYMPSGISLTYADTIQYNFRLKVNNLFVRIRGSYSKEMEIIKKISEAVDNPHAYIRKRDPEYFLHQLDRLSQRMDKLQKENAQLQKTIDKYRRGYMALHNEGFFSGPALISEYKVAKVLEIKKKNPNMKKDKVKEILEKQKVEISSKELTIIFLVYFNESK